MSLSSAAISSKQLWPKGLDLKGKIRFCEACRKVLINPFFGKFFRHEGRVGRKHDRFEVRLFSRVGPRRKRSAVFHRKRGVFERCLRASPCTLR